MERAKLTFLSVCALTIVVALVVWIHSLQIRIDDLKADIRILSNEVENLQKRSRSYPTSRSSRQSVSKKPPRPEKKSANIAVPRKPKTTKRKPVKSKPDRPKPTAPKATPQG